ncbi:hypothetical protein CT0861_10339 [Colletotrichum tofieldiae]|uniref:Uncharacterized protein n=1 Tax=Colletotrichum tofieldiae TaxID=708197 RepID=A0A166P1X8_9PEZI|nr:hypothetical protein CT0861_10339 [Colletotrichum tofieldiae]
MAESFYIIITPDPTIGAQTFINGQETIWIKIGDASSPEDRRDMYKTHNCVFFWEEVKLVRSQQTQQAGDLFGNYVGTVMKDQLFGTVGQNDYVRITGTEWYRTTTKVQKVQNLAIDWASKLNTGTQNMKYFTRRDECRDWLRGLLF